MSYYYNYYLGYKDKQNKIYPLAPFDNRGKLRSCYSISRSFASDLYELFRKVSDQEMSDELIKEFSYEGFNGERRCDVKWLLPSELPDDNYYIYGYFRTEDVQDYIESKEDIDVDNMLYYYKNPTVYAAMAANEIRFGRQPAKKDEFGEDISDPAASEYMFYAVPQYNSKEYESFLIQRFANAFELSVPDECTMVILETEG